MMWILVALLSATNPQLDVPRNLHNVVKPTPTALAVRPPKARPTYTLPGAPKTPEGLSACTDAIVLEGDLPRYLGETIRYTVEIDGLSVGLVDFKTEKEGLFEGKVVTEYRSHFQIDSLVATLVPVEGRAAAIVPHGQTRALQAMNRYQLKEKKYEEELVWDETPGSLLSKRSRAGKTREVKRLFTSESRDFITAFYMLRAMPPKFSGCTILFANQRAYTLQIQYVGEERVKTPVGFKDADRYNVLYAHERSKKPIKAAMWISKEKDRLPYQAEIFGRSHLFARVHLFIPGEDQR